MNKNAIKEYAIWARRELIDRVSQKAFEYGITKEIIEEVKGDTVKGIVLSNDQKEHRKKLVSEIKEKGFDQVMEEAAYTWFNRFIALRFMEVNNYLPQKVRPFTDDENKFNPQIISEAMDLDFVDKNTVYSYKDRNDTDGLYKYLLISLCNDMNQYLPGMFETIDSYRTLLFPDLLLREGSVISRMITDIDEDSWKDQVQIIGWLYQFYNTEPKDKVFANLKKNIKISKENIPAATQLFTPDWIVHYMVENSLGRLWLEGHPNEKLKSEWKYYLDEAEQEPEVQAQLDEIRKEYANIQPEDIKVIDPCMGSGHILCVLFDVLISIYEDYGYSSREAVINIVEKNLWGLDIDERASQLAYFAVMMKARQYDRRFLTRELQPHVYAIKESNNLDAGCIEYFIDGRRELKIALNTLIDELYDAKEYGSILRISSVDYEALFARFSEISNDENLLKESTLDTLLPLVQSAQAISQRYHVISTNPPYMASGSMDDKLLSFIKRNYPNGKNDLYSVFIERCIVFTKPNAYVSMITQHSWMFLSRFERLRLYLQNYDTINMAHLGARAFEEIGGEIVQTTSFVKRNSSIRNYIGTYCRLVDGGSQDKKEELYLSGYNRFYCTQQAFTNIYGSPVAYWISKNMMHDFTEKELGDYGETRQGFATGDNGRFLRYWYEVDISKLAFGCKNSEMFWEKGAIYSPCNKGGEARKWYGNNLIVCKYDREAYEALLTLGNHLPSRDYYFRKGLTWSTLGTSFLSMRYSPEGFLFETKGSMYFAHDDENLKYLLGVMNSKVAMLALQVLCPTIDFHEGPVSHVPIIIKDKARIDILVEENISIAKKDWDSFEISWDFKRHPLAREQTVEAAFSLWNQECEDRFSAMRANEEEINRILLSAYGLIHELSPDVDMREITLSKADRSRDIRNLISFAVGCMFGRYSLDHEGITYAGGVWENNNTQIFSAGKDGIIPISDDEYFQDDIVKLFIDFIKVLYGEDYLEENLSYIAKSLGGKGTSREVLRSYFLNDFYSDHLKVYKKTPIYWLFESGKKNGFKCLVYMHRYQEDTVAKIRTDYLHEQQERYHTIITDIEQQIRQVKTSERVKLSKRLNTLMAQAEEARLYEEKVHHLADKMIRIDLDVGVKKNYKILSDILAKLK